MVGAHGRGSCSPHGSWESKRKEEEAGVPKSLQGQAPMTLLPPTKPRPPKVPPPPIGSGGDYHYLEVKGLETLNPWAFRGQSGDSQDPNYRNHPPWYAAQSLFH
jgi:hypothetical protein